MFTEKDLSELAAALGLSYEIDYDWTSARLYLENRSCVVAAWIKMKGLKSKRYAVFAYDGDQLHTKRHCLEISLPYELRPDDVSLSPKAVRLVRNRAADFMVRRILIGCSIKISNTRRVTVPQSGSVEEMKLKMTVFGGRMR